MIRRIAAAVTVMLAASACGGTFVDLEPADTTTTTLALQVEPTTTAAAPTTTAAPPTTSAGVTTTSTLPEPVVAGLIGPNQEGAPPVSLVVSSASGIDAVSGGGVGRLVEGKTVVATDDLAGGLVFQVASGRGGAYEFGGLATRVWWVPPGASAAQELLVPASDQALTLHDVVLHDGRPTVFYTRSEGATPEDTRDRLRRFDLGDRTVTDLAVIGGWESGADPSIGGGMVALTWYAEGWQGIDFRSAETGQPREVSANPAPGEYECCLAPQLIEMDPDGMRFAYLEYRPDAAGFFTAPDLVVVDLVTGSETFRATLDRPEGGWLPASVDFAGDFVVVNRHPSDRFDDPDALAPAWVVELGRSPRVWEVEVAGNARLLRSTPDIATPITAPAPDS